MGKIIHMRGDISGMLIFFILLLLGLWQIVVALKRLNGLSLTGYPDRKIASIVLGISIVTASGIWYFSRKGHFASPDVEGVETFLLLIIGIIISTIIEFLLSSIFFFRKSRMQQNNKVPSRGKEIEIITDKGKAFALFFKPEDPKNHSLIILHDYGEISRSIIPIGEKLAEAGYTSIAPDLDGHGKNCNSISDPKMQELLESAYRQISTGQNIVVSILGIGYGALVAMEFAKNTGSISNVFAVDPPAQDESGIIYSNALREFKPYSIISSFIRPPARGEEGRISLSRLISQLPPPESSKNYKLFLFGTKNEWFNSPDSILSLARKTKPLKTIFLDERHASFAQSEKLAQCVIKLLENHG
jgi:pimeloyl-ACP methyl ester carboxylesterase